MINDNDHIRAKNVISMKYNLNFKKFSDAIEDFLNIVNSLKVNINGYAFYSINGAAENNENIEVEFFISVLESYVDVPEFMKFHSYFSIENMISITVFNNYEENGEEGYAKLIRFMDENNLKQVTPFFNVASGDKTMQYTFLKVGVS